MLPKANIQTWQIKQQMFTPLIVMFPFHLMQFSADKEQNKNLTPC